MALPKVSREEREAIAERRILSVLGTLTVANLRTLEQKISDAGPGNQRIDPHILSDTKTRLIQEGIIAQRMDRGTPWFFASNTPSARIDARLAELLAIYRPYRDISGRIGQALEIATFRALSLPVSPPFYGRFLNLDSHDDAKAYRKQDPPDYIGSRSTYRQQNVDFIAWVPAAGAVGIECKNVRHWIYPHSEEIQELLRKCLALDIVPALISRRIHFSTFAVFNKCGLIVHQMYNQLLPASEAALAAQVRDKTMLGYHDVRLGNDPDVRLTKFICENLAKVAPAARAKFEDYRDLLSDYATGEISYAEFAGRAGRRSRGENEDGIPDDPDIPPEWAR